MDLLFWIAAVISFAIATLLGFGTFSGAHLLGWLSLGLVFLAIALALGISDTLFRRKT